MSCAISQELELTHHVWEVVPVPALHLHHRVEAASIRPVRSVVTHLIRVVAVALGICLIVFVGVPRRVLPLGLLLLYSLSFILTMLLRSFDCMNIRFNGPVRALL